MKLKMSLTLNNKLRLYYPIDKYKPGLTFNNIEIRTRESRIMNPTLYRWAILLFFLKRTKENWTPWKLNMNQFPHQSWFLKKIKKLRITGLEPVTNSLKVSCSTKLSYIPDYVKLLKSYYFVLDIRFRLYIIFNSKSLLRFIENIFKPVIYSKSLRKIQGKLLTLYWFQ